MNAWLWLTIAIVFEIGATTCLKLSQGLTKLFPSLLTFVLYIISFGSLAISLKFLEIGIVYAIWAGVGTGVITLIGIIFFGESVSFIKVGSITLIILGVIGLNLAGSQH